MPRKLSFAITILALTALAQTLEAQQTHVVGWTIPPGGPLVYQLWASFQKFTVGDILVFNFATGLHTVARVTKEAYDSCNSTSPVAIEAISPVNFPLDSVGEYYFICSVPAHCPLGQKLAVNVTAPCGCTPFRPPLPRPLTTSTRRDAVSYVVGDTLGWLVPPGGATAYSTWASPKTFTVGDSLVFNFITGQQDVARVTKEVYDTCNTKNTTTLGTTGPTNFRLETVGDYYFIGTMGRRCSLGQKLAIKVTGLRDGPVTYTVGDGLGWLPLPGGALAYSTWAYNKNFVAGDILVFNFVNKTQDVALVTKLAYENCDTNDTISLWTTSPARVTLTASGEHYFTSTYPLLCTFGQKLAINVSATASPSPEGHSTTSDETLSPSSSSVRPSHADGALCFTTFSLVLAFFIN